MIDPYVFVISRKRKKYKFAKFANSPLCFEYDEWDRQITDVLEIGAGTGLFTVERAQLHPDLQFVAVDVKGDRLQKGAYEAEARGLTNIRFLRARGDQLLDVFSKTSIQQLWITFPDPFPKSKSGAQRLTHPTFLRLYAKLLADDGALYFKTDARELFNWSLERLVAEGWRITELSFDLHESDFPSDYKIMIQT